MVQVFINAGYQYDTPYPSVFSDPPCVSPGPLPRLTPVPVCDACVMSLTLKFYVYFYKFLIVFSPDHFHNKSAKFHSDSLTQLVLTSHLNLWNINSLGIDSRINWYQFLLNKSIRNAISDPFSKSQFGFNLDATSRNYS